MTVKRFRPFGMKHTPFDPMTGAYLSLNPPDNNAETTFGGSGGAEPGGSLASLGRVTIDTSTLVDGQSLVWDAETQSWVNGPTSTGANAEPEDPGEDVVELGSNVEGDETALTDEWTAGGIESSGLKEWYVARVVYNHNGDKVLYAFLRHRVYDSYGRLYYVSAETRVDVDVTEEET